MEKINRYLDKIKAEEEIKEKTKLFLMDKLLEIENQRAIESKRKSSFWSSQRILTPLAAVAAAVILVFAGLLFYRTPVAYVSLDINPSVEIAVNALNRVVGIEAANEDGVKIMQGLNLRNMTIDYAIQMMVQRSYEQGYIAEDGSTVIAIVSMSDEIGRVTRINERLTENISTFLEEENMFAVVYATTAKANYRGNYQGEDVSSGKYRLIEILQEIDPQIDKDQYKDVKIADILQKADQLADESDPPKQFNEQAKQRIEQVREIAGEVNQNREKAEAFKQQQGQNNGNKPTPTDEAVYSSQPGQGQSRDSGPANSSNPISGIGGSRPDSGMGDSQHGEPSQGGNTPVESGPSDFPGSSGSSDSSSISDSGQGNDSGNRPDTGYSSEPPRPTNHPGQKPNR